MHGHGKDFSVTNHTRTEGMTDLGDQEASIPAIPRINLFNFSLCTPSCLDNVFFSQQLCLSSCRSSPPLLLEMFTGWIWSGSFSITHLSAIAVLQWLEQREAGCTGQQPGLEDNRDHVLLR